MRTKSKAAAYFDVPAMNQQAIASQFKEFKTEVANAIREKKGTTEAIHPKDFGEEIKSLSGGIKYYRYDGDQAYSKYETLDTCLPILCAVKFQWHERSKDENSANSKIQEIVAGKTSVRHPTHVPPSNWEQIDLLAFAVDENARYYREWEGEWTSVKEEFSQLLNQEFPVTEITKEEFYDIPQMFTLKPSQVSDELKYYMYKEGQTWGEWVNSSYNTIGAYVDNPDGGGKEYILVEPYTVIRDRNAGNWVEPSDLIQSNTVYDYSGTIPV